MKYDIIIIGAGLGGLTAAAKLAKEGKKVLLLEQHDRVGGCATTFRRKDYTLEVGLHEMDGPSAKDLKVKIFRDLGIQERFTLLQLPEFYRFVNDRVDFVMPHQADEAILRLVERFPAEEAGIRIYFDYLLNYRKYAAEMASQSEKSLGDFLDEHIHNDDLKLVLLGNLGYFHDDPYSISLAYYLIAQGSYFGGSASFVKGGSQVLCNALMSVVLDMGGEVKLNTLVTKILIEHDKAIGVDYQFKSTNYTDFATEIIVNASVPRLANELLPETHAKALKEAILDVKIGASLLTVYFGFKTPLKELGNIFYSTFVFHSSIKTMKDVVKNNHADFDVRGFTLVDYSQIDAQLSPEGKSVGAVCCIDYAADWEGLDPTSYRQRKSEVASQIIRRCEEIIPGFSQAVEYVEVATPLTVQRYTLNPEGAVYGFAQNPGKSQEYLSKLPQHIYIASAWGKFGGGFSGSIYSGYMTAMEVMRKR